MAWNELDLGNVELLRGLEMISREMHWCPNSRASLSATSLPRLYEPLEIVMIGMKRFRETPGRSQRRG
jgi:hypothetical protein